MELSPEPAVDPKKKWTRAKVPRVRTGCTTCKKRHLKCDEEKPHCQRCQRDKFPCDGYPAFVPRRRSFGKGPRNKQPEPPQEAVILHHEAVILHPRPHTLSISISKIPIEIDLLHHVRTCTLREFGMASASREFWSIHVIPMAQAFDPIRYALCALGGAHKCFKYQGKEDAGTYHSRRNLEQVSIELYNQAIYHIASMEGTKCQEHMEIILTCCVIFICIENILGRYHEGLRHLKGGSDLINSFRQASSSKDGGAKRWSGFFDDIAILMSGLATDAALYSGYDTVPELHFCVLAKVEKADTSLPFNSIQAVARELNAIEQEYSARVHLASSQASAAVGFWGSKNGDFPSPESSSEDQACAPDACVPAFTNWRRRFAAFRDSVCERELSRADSYRLKSLVVEEAVWEALLELPPSGDTVPRANCVKILQAVEVLVEAEDFMSCPTFVLEPHIIPVLSMVCSSSADDDIQRKSIQMLRSLQIREGIWEGKKMADTLELALADIKAKGLEKSMLPWNMPGLSRAATHSPLLRSGISTGTISVDQFKPDGLPPGQVWEFEGRRDGEVGG